MAIRKTPLRIGFTYHVYNQGIDRRTVFTSKREYHRALQTLNFYQHQQNFTKLSHYLVSGRNQLSILEKVHSFDKLNTILAYCLMPNHYHLALTQLAENGISKYIGNFQNSYTKYFNAKHHRKGPLFLKPFKAVLVETDNQLFHLIRYIHLNPYSSGIINSAEHLFTYPYSSLHDYFQPPMSNTIVEPKFYQQYFTNPEKHKSFILDQADYQKTLDSIKHLTHEHQLNT